METLTTYLIVCCSFCISDIILTMDAYLSREAYKSLEALNLVAPHASPDGLLIGHKRGHRYFVEKVFPALKGFSSLPHSYFDLDQLFEGELIGFFSLNPEEKRIKKILAPFAYGKLFLKIYLENKRITIQSFIIDYEEEFCLSPIQLRT